MRTNRVYLSIIRRKSNALFFGILICVSVFLIAALTIYQSSGKNISEIEKTYGSSFKIQIVRDDSDPSLWEERVIEGTQGNTTLNFYIGPNVDEEMMNRIAEVDGIKDFEAGRDWEVMLYEYELIPGWEIADYKYLLEVPNPEQLMFTAEEIKNTIYITQCFPIRNSTNFKEFYNGVFRLCEGRHIVDTDVHKAIISRALADRNHLSLGDTLIIDTDSLNVRAAYPVESLGNVETEIVGLFETTYQQQVTEYTEQYDIMENWVLVDTQTGYNLNQLYGENNSLYTGTFFVDNPAEIDQVMKDVKNLDWIDWSYYRLFKDDSQYSEAIAPLRTMRIIMAGILVVSVIAGIVLLMLTVTHSVKKRTREMGILLSIGLNGKEIRQQVILEHLLIGIAAFFCALLIGTAVTPTLGSQLYGTINKGNEQKVYTEKELEAAIARGEREKVAEMAKNQRTGVEPPETIDTGVNATTIIFVFFAEMLIIVVCVDCAIKKTLKLEPIRVLSMIE